jgi:hypothetical protein
MISRFCLPLVCLALLVAAQAAEMPVMPYDSAIGDRGAVDGFVDVEESEYPASFTDKTTGITVHWGFDDSLIYVALETKGAGWLAIGLGSAKMNESNMIIGYWSDDSSAVYNQLGSGYAHADVAGGDSFALEADIDRDDETGVTTMEFSYPLQFPKVAGLAIPGLVAGDTYDMILAQNTKTIDLRAKHTQKAALKFQMASNPHAQKKQ